MEAYQIPNVQAEGQSTVSLRCPRCRQQGTLDPVGNHDYSDGRVHQQKTVFGQRRCPNPDCRAHVFVIYDHGPSAPRVVASYPPETIDFDATELPEQVLASLQEAVQCLSIGCYRAAAIMVRRTLEEVCEERGASGGNLRRRLEELKGQVILPAELLEALDHLRLLGNDAAHIEAKTYNEVGQSEVTLGIDVTKELLKSVYQYKDLVGRLKALQRPDSPEGAG